MNILERFRSPQLRAARRRAAVACGLLASLSVCGGAAAQFGPIIELPPNLQTVTLMPAPPASYPPTVASTAPGTYYGLPAWSQMFAPNVRFVILSNFNRDAVLDRATGLVWTRRSIVDSASINGAGQLCRNLIVGSRMGWRLPAISELVSLLDPSVQSPGQPKLPVGHPFLVSSVIGDNFFLYWASQYDELTPNLLAVELTTGVQGVPDTVQLGVLCVRGPGGVEARVR